MAATLTERVALLGVVVVGSLWAHHLRADDDYYLDKVWTTPDYCQSDPAYGGFPDDEGVLHGNVFCGPTAGSNSLMWLADHGFPNLASDSGDRKRDQHDLIAAIAQPAYMNAYETNGVGITYFCRGFMGVLRALSSDFDASLTRLPALRTAAHSGRFFPRIKKDIAGR